MELEGEKLMSFHETDRRFKKTNGFTRTMVDRGLLKVCKCTGTPRIRYTEFVKFLDKYEGCEKLLGKAEG